MRKVSLLAILVVGRSLPAQATKTWAAMIAQAVGAERPIDKPEFGAPCSRDAVEFPDSVGLVTARFAQTPKCGSAGLTTRRAIGGRCRRRRRQTRDLSGRREIMISRPIRYRIRNTKSRTTREAARDPMYTTRQQTLTRWLGTESNRRHADFQEACRSPVNLLNRAKVHSISR